MEVTDWQQELAEVAAAIAEAAQETGRGIRAARESRMGWSQSELAANMRRLGFNWHQTTVGKIEAGTRTLRWDEALALAYLHCHNPIDSLLSGHLKGDHLALQGLLVRRELLYRKALWSEHAQHLGWNDEWIKYWTQQARDAEEKYHIEILDDGDGVDPT